MNASEMTFGIEIECNLPVAKMAELEMRVGGYHRGTQVPGLPEGWNAQQDSSIQTTDYTFAGVEIVSPVLSGPDGIAQVKTVVAWINGIGGKVNASCGFHCHVGFARQSAGSLAKLVCLVASHEQALFAMTGTKSREANHYCKSIKQDFRPLAARGNLDRCASAANDRYHALNLSNLANGRPTVEFRCFAGTLNILKILAYIQVCIGLAQKAINSKSKVSYDAKPLDAETTIKGTGEGERAVNRLFYSLFWKFNGGFRATVATDPKWTPFGIIDAETLAAAGDKALQMARKYDTAAVAA